MDVAKLLKLEASAGLAKQIMAGAQLPQFPEQLSADCGKAPSAGMQASPHPGMFGELMDSLCHGEGIVHHPDALGGRLEP